MPNNVRDIPYYNDYISSSFLEHLLQKATAVTGVSELVQVGESFGLETKSHLPFYVNFMS